MELIIERLWNVLHWSDFVYSFTKNGKEMEKIIETSENFTRNIIRITKDKYLNGELKIGDEKRKSLMEVLLEHHLLTKELSEEDIREEVITFVIAGHHSSATSLTWTLYLIGLHKEVQCKIQAELQWIFGDDHERPVSNEDLKEMKYLESVIKESLRLFPSVYMFARHISEDIKICQVFALIEEKIILSTLLRNYSFESLEPRDHLPPTVDIVLKPSKPIKLKIRPRKRTS